MRLDRAAMVRRLRFGGLLGVVGRVLVIAFSWALAWLALFALIPTSATESVSLGQMARWLALMGVFLGILFGVAHEVAGRGRKASEFTLTRTLVCGFIACVFEQTLHHAYLAYREPDLGISLGNVGARLPSRSSTTAADRHFT